LESQNQKSLTVAISPATGNLTFPANLMPEGRQAIARAGEFVERVLGSR
jgi:hypothetical protein